jgi:YggT family protein
MEDQTRDMEDRTEIIETTSETTRDGTRDPRLATEARRQERTVGPESEVRSREHVVAPASEVNRVEAVAYDPYANNRLITYRVTQLIYWIFGLIEGLILIRFALKALGANPSAGFADFIYRLTAPLVMPFVGLFGNPSAQGSILELQSIMALIVYALLAWLLARLVWILGGDVRSAVETRATRIDSHV